MIKKIIISLLLLSTIAAFAATHTVTNSADSGNGSEGDSIDFSNTISTITLTSGQITIDYGISIDGEGNVTIDGNSNSRIFYIDGINTITVSVEGVTFQSGRENSGDGGGAIYIRNEHVTITKCIFQKNTFTRNGNNRGGGAIHNRNGYLNLISCIFRDNSYDAGTRGGGGAIFAGYYSQASTIIDDCRIEYNTSSADGGGVYIYRGALNIKNGSTLSYNKTIDDGGGICVNSINVDFFLDKNITFYKNNCGDNGGGLFYISMSEITIKSCDFYGNSSEDLGGAIYVYNSKKINISESVFTNNNSRSDSGGAIYNNSTDSTGLIYKCEFNNNISARYGGAVYHNGFMDIIDSEFTSNVATNRAGAAYIRRAKISGSTFTKNHTIEENNYGGGALYTFGDTTLSNTYFFSNYANGNGGAVRISSSSAKVIVHAGGFAENSAKHGGGGAIQVNAAASLNLYSKFNNNNATIDGGAVWANRSYMTVIITNSYFDGNAAKDDAGSLYVGGTASVVNCTFTNSYAEDNGGAIACFANSSAGKIIDCAINNNSANDRGAAAFIQGNWTIENSTVISNSATIDGGGFYFAGAGASTINVNSCSNNGGGIDTELKFTLKDSKIINNYAVDLGGGIYNYAPDASFTSLIYNCIISTNIANNSSGGGICQNNSAVIFDSSVISMNKSANYGGGIFANSNNRTISIISKTRYL